MHHRLLAGIDVAKTEERLAAAALAVGFHVAAWNTAEAAFIFHCHRGLVGEVNKEVFLLGDAVLAAANLLLIVLNDPVIGTEGTAAVDAQADRFLLATGELADKAFFNFAGLGVYRWHISINVPTDRLKMSKFRDRARVPRLVLEYTLLRKTRGCR